MNGDGPPPASDGSISIRICGSMTRQTARCSRKSRFLQMRLAHRSHMVGSKQYIAFPVGGGPIAEELIAVSLTGPDIGSLQSHENQPTRLFLVLWHDGCARLSGLCETIRASSNNRHSRSGAPAWVA